MSKWKLKTIEDAFDFVQAVKVCTVFSGKLPGALSLYDVVDLPDDDGETRWGQRVEAVWAWKTDLPTFYPDDIFYGKVGHGVAVLMSMDHLAETHYPKAHLPVSDCSRLAREVFEIVRLGPSTTSDLRKEAMEALGCKKGAFDRALKELQTTLNITRLNEPGLKRDTWVVFSEVYDSFL